MSRTLQRVRCLVWMWIVIGCSQPASPTVKRPPNPDDTPDVPALGPIIFRYDWEKRFEETKHAQRHHVWPGSPCLRKRDQMPSNENGFFYPPGPEDIAANVARHERAGTGTVLWLGADVDDTWSGVLLDDAGYALHEWTCVEVDHGSNPRLTIELPIEQVRRYRHVALFQNPPPLKKPR
jgi:hypothetical protein